MKIVKQERQNNTLLCNLSVGDVFQLVDAPDSPLVDHWKADDFYFLLDQPIKGRTLEDLVEILNLSCDDVGNRMKIDSSSTLVSPFDAKLIVIPKVVQ